MKKQIVYKFYDWDSVANTECDIMGEDYKQLISLCCKYSTTMSVIIKNETESIYSQLQKFEISRPPKITYHYSNYGLGSLSDSQIGVRYYQVCTELCILLQSSFNSIFEWLHGWGYNNPEDPVFYRNDGSVFFSSIIHEGEITLSPLDAEDTSNITNSVSWKKVGGSKKSEDCSISSENDN